MKSKSDEQRHPQPAVANYAITDLHHNCFIGDLSQVKKILKNNPHNLNILDNVGRTPLHFAAGNNQVEIVEILLELGAITNQVDDKGRTALDVAIEKKSLATAELLKTM